MTDLMAQKQEFFDAIKKNDSVTVRQLLQSNRELCHETIRDPTLKFDKDVELDSYKFIGAYLGSLTGLQLSILLGHDSIARDIIDSSFQEELDIVFGGNNTALHLATFLNARDIVSTLLQRGANKNIKNTKGFAPVDLIDDTELRSLFQAGSRDLLQDVDSPVSP